MSKKSANTSIKIIEGKIPILLSAPHTFPHLRQNLDGVYRSQESWLDTILESVSATTGVSCVFTNSQLDYDPNFDDLSKNEYKAAVSALVKQGKIEYFIDLHGLSDIHEYDFGVLYPLRYSKSKNLAYTFAQEMNKGSIKGALFQIHNLFDDDRETISEYVAKKLKIPAVQIEIARYLREDAELRADLIDNLASLIVKL